MRRWCAIVLLLSGCTVLDKSLWRVQAKGDLFVDGQTEPFFGRDVDLDGEMSSVVEVPDWSVDQDTRWTLFFEIEDHHTITELYEGESSGHEGSGGPLGISRLEDTDLDLLAGYSSYYSYTVTSAGDRKMVFDVDIQFDDGSSFDGELVMKGFAEAKDDTTDTGTCTYCAR